MGGGWLWSFFQIVLIILIIYVIYQLVISNRRSSPAEAADDALKILDARYARGEIDEEEYNRKKRAIQDR